MKRLFVSLSTIAWIGCSSFGGSVGDCRLTADRQATIAVDGATRARIAAGAGQLEILGVADLTEVRVRGQACASDQDLLEVITISVERIGEEMVIEAGIPQPRRWNSQARMDLRVEVPEGLALDVSDGSGNVEARNVGPMSLNDGSGSIDIEGASGSLSIDDGSGDIAIRNVDGDVKLSDGSGTISVSDVRGAVRVRDGSGNIKVSRITGDFIVEGDGSGSVRHEDVGGRVSIRD